MENINSELLYVEKLEKPTVTVKITGEYAWARITDEILAKIKPRELQENYHVQYVEPWTLTGQTWCSGYGEGNDPVPFLIWCQKYEVYESRGAAIFPYTTFVYRPVKKTDIPIANLDLIEISIKVNKGNKINDRKQI